MKFQDKLDKIIGKNNSLICVGLDTDLNKLPSHIKTKKYPIFEFNKAIIDVTSDLVCAYKPNSAFYEAQGVDGILQLKQTCDYLNVKYPNIPIILDAKRADIGYTNNGYVDYVFKYLQVDAITLNPYLGQEALEPFLQLKDKGLIILCRTSNKGATEFQDLLVKGQPLYKIIARKVIDNWNKNKNCLLVIGATYPKELGYIRKMSDKMTFLVPGIGAQGADLQETLKMGLNTHKSGLIINAGRSVIYASSDKDFPKKAREAAKKLKEEINKYRYHR